MSNLADDQSWREKVRIQTKYASRNPIARALTGGFLRTLSELVVPVLRDQPEARVLEAGCGEGINMSLLEKLPEAERAHLEGFDIDEPSLANARQLVERAKIYEASIYEIPHAENSFDLVLCLEVLEHLEEPERALGELRRVARDRVVVSVPREPLWRALNMARGKYLKDFGNTEGHLNHWSKRRFVNLVSGYFEIEEVRSPIPWTMLCARKK